MNSKNCFGWRGKCKSGDRIVKRELLDGRVFLGEVTMRGKAGSETASQGQLHVEFPSAFSSCYQHST